MNIIIRGYEDKTDLLQNEHQANNLQDHDFNRNFNTLLTIIEMKNILAQFF